MYTGSAGYVSCGGTRTGNGTENRWFLYCDHDDVYADIGKTAKAGNLLEEGIEGGTSVKESIKR